MISPNLSNVFEDASVDSSVFVFSKDKSAYTGTKVFNYNNNDFELKYIVQQENFRNSFNREEFLAEGFEKNTLGMVGNGPMQRVMIKENHPDFF